VENSGATFSIGDSDVPRNFVRGGGAINLVEDRGERENGDLGTVAP